MATGRFQHNVIYDGEVFMVIGGYESAYADTLHSEKCTLSGSTMTCTKQTPYLTNYSRTPALIMVPEDFCTEI